MISTLITLRQSGRIDASVPSVSQRGRKGVPAGHLTLIVNEGRILSWILIDTQGKPILSGSEENLAYLQQVYQMRIKWTFQATTSTLPTLTPENSAGFSQFSPAQKSPRSMSPSTPRSMSPSTPRSMPPSSPQHTPHPPRDMGNAQNPIIPYRAKPISPQMLTQMPRQYRMVYALINGINDVRHIHSLLPALSPATIEAILHDLQAHGLINW